MGSAITESEVRMSRELKSSRYNHSITTEDGELMAFNALSCGLGSVDARHRDKFIRLLEDGVLPESGSPEDKEFESQLIEGGFLIPEGSNEIDAIRVMHYKSRFGAQAGGMTLIPTLNCNFACDYCYEDEKIHTSLDKDKMAISESVQQRIVSLAESKIQNNSSFTITWYGGEPLLQQKTIQSLTEKIRDICVEKDSKYFAGIITNGYLLNREAVDLLAGCGVVFCQVTIDGGRETHDARRPLRSGGKTYDRILENLENTPDDGPISFSIRVNIDKRNEEAIGRLLEDLKSRGFHRRRNISFYFGQVVHVGNSCRDISHHCMITEEFAEFQIQAYKLALNMGFKISVYPATMFGSCGAVSKHSIVVEPSGVIHNCWNTVGMDRMKTGELAEDGANYNENYLKWLGWTPFRDECKQCNVLPLCMGGCPFKTLFDSEMTDADKNTCVWWKYNLPKMMDLYRAASRLGMLRTPGVQGCADEENGKKKQMRKRQGEQQ